MSRNGRKSKARSPLGPALIDAAEVARWASLPEEEILRMAREEEIPARMVGPHFRFVAEEVVASSMGDKGGVTWRHSKSVVPKLISRNRRASITTVAENGQDPIARLGAARELEGHSLALLVNAVSYARSQDPPVTWDDIGRALGISKQAVIQRFRSRNG